jgi:hypothetical protein
MQDAPADADGIAAPGRKRSNRFAGDLKAFRNICRIKSTHSM